MYMYVNEFDTSIHFYKHVDIGQTIILIFINNLTCNSHNELPCLLMKPFSFIPAYITDTITNMDTVTLYGYRIN